MRCAWADTHKHWAPSPLQRLVRSPVWPLSESPGPVWWGQLKSKAHNYSTPLGWAEITHPFHPLHGQRFPILKTRRVSGIETLLLQGTSMGTFAVPQQWTDQGYEKPHKNNFLDFTCLTALRDLVRSLHNTKKGVDK